jgi:CDGSH-type Zn-finger protein/uncharacterized Fe-S cluster protein YjdI
MSNPTTPNPTDAPTAPAPTALATPVEEARGEKVVVRFDGKRCIHSRQCVLGAPNVFLANVEGPWIQPDAMTPEALTEVAHACPSGAITYERLDGGPAETAPPVNIARIRENGPVALHGELNLIGHGAILRATLCRCGASKNKPFCDTSHVAIGFKATGEPATQESPPLPVRNGPLTLTPYPDGPVGFQGNLEVVSGTGRTVTRKSRGALCRCGQSSTKPFCDGTHAKVGFTAE